MLLSSGLPGGSWQAVAVVTAPTPLPQVSSRCSGRPSVRPLVCLPGLCGVPPSPLLSLRSCVRDCACFHVTACAQRLEDSLGCQAPLTLLLEAGSLVFFHCVCQASRLQSFGRFSGLHFLSPHRSSRDGRHSGCVSRCDKSPGDPSSGPHTWTKRFYLPSHPRSHGCCYSVVTG